jgi:hypothetical protein
VGQVCSAGICTCDHGWALCNGICVNVQTDTNCGQCGNSCTGGRTCSDGQCVCPQNLTFCNGRCVDTKQDSENCGGCSATCSSQEVCSGGQCICSGGLTPCPGGVCTDLGYDPVNCGRCGRKCETANVCMPFGGYRGCCYDECSQFPAVGYSYPNLGLCQNQDISTCLDPNVCQGLGVCYGVNLRGHPRGVCLYNLHDTLPSPEDSSECA